MEEAKHLPQGWVTNCDDAMLWYLQAHLTGSSTYVFMLQVQTVQMIPKYKNVSQLSNQECCNRIKNAISPSMCSTVPISCPENTLHGK